MGRTWWPMALRKRGAEWCPGSWLGQPCEWSYVKRNKGRRSVVISIWAACPWRSSGVEWKDTTGNQKKEGNYETSVRLLKRNSFLGLGWKTMPRMNTCQEKPLVWGLPLEVASRYFPSRPTSWEVALATSQVLIQEVLSHLRFMIAFLLSTCVMFP